MPKQQSDASPSIETIDATDDEQLRAWAKKLDSTHDQILAAVKEVGSRAADVEMHLKGTRATTNADLEARAESGQRPD